MNVEQVRVIPWPPARKAVANADTCYVQLGHLGDILNILPVMKSIHESTGKRPVVMTCKEYAPIFDRISYAKCRYWEGKDWDALAAAQVAIRQGYNPVHCMFYGTSPNRKPDDKALFCIEQWRLLGKQNEWGKLPMVFDKRDHNAEASVVNQLRARKPYVVLNTASKTSPMPFPEHIKRLVKRWARIQVVDISDYRCDNFVDLLRLLEQAELLVSVDSAPVHLNRATHTPCLQFGPNDPWLNAKTVENVKHSFTFAEIPYRSTDIGRVICRATKRKVEQPRIIHVVGRFMHRSADAHRRYEFAATSWEPLYQHYGWEPCHVWRTPRTAASIDPRWDNFMHKDLWMEGLNKCKHGSDVIVYTNDDTVLRPEIHEQICERLTRQDAFCGLRNDYARGRFASPLEMTDRNTTKTVGRDIFVFRSSWLLDNWSWIPDVVMGTSDWDYVLGVLFRHRVGCKLTMPDMMDVNPYAELDRGCVFHEAHKPDRFVDKECWKIIEKDAAVKCRNVMLRIPGTEDMHLVNDWNIWSLNSQK